MKNIDGEQVGSNVSGELVGSVEEEIYQCFLSFIPSDTPKQIAEHGAKFMAVTAISQTIEECRKLNIGPEEAMQRLLLSLKYDHLIPKDDNVIH